jgi:hypothetical protein
MRLFLSYASEDQDLAEQIFLALTAAGHRVVFDKDSLPAGGDYHTRIRRAVDRSDAFVFLITPRSLAPGSFALSELKYARAKWVHPRGRVLPVVVDVTDLGAIPPYLRAVTLLQPQGDVAAEATLAVAEMQKSLPAVAMPFGFGGLSLRALGGVALGILMATVSLLYYFELTPRFWTLKTPEPSARSDLQSPSDVPTRIDKPPAETVQRALADPSVVFSDSFGTATLSSEWQPVSGDWKADQGVLKGVGSHFTTDAGRQWASITLNRSIPADSVISFKVRIVDGSTAELMLRLSKNKYVRAYIYAIDQSVNLGAGTFINDDRPGSIGLKEVLQSIGGGPTLTSHSFPIRMSTWYSVVVSAIGNQYVIKIGGQTVIDFTDSGGKLNREGAIGFITNGSIEIDDLEVRSADAVAKR